MTTTKENPSIHGKSAGITLVVLANLAGLPIFPASLVIAGFTLWGIGEPNYPPPFLVDPMEWFWNFISISMPVAVSTVIIGVCVSYRRREYDRIRLYFLVGIIYGVLWLPGMSKVMSL